MDAAGKDGTIKHVMSGVNPQGCQVYSFKTPSAEELDHDFLWRTTRCLPERGRIGIFNRSYYEEVLVVRVHPEFLAGQKLPASLLGKGVWKERFEDISGFERYLARNGIAVRKFFLHVSQEEQKKRFLERLDEPEKNWKFSAGGRRASAATGTSTCTPTRTRSAHTATRARALVRGARRQQVVHPARGGGGGRSKPSRSSDLHYPKVDKAQRKELQVARDLLAAEEKGGKKKDDGGDDGEDGE